MDREPTRSCTKAQRTQIVLRVAGQKSLARPNVLVVTSKKNIRLFLYNIDVRGDCKSAQKSPGGIRGSDCLQNAFSRSCRRPCETAAPRVCVRRHRWFLQFERSRKISRAPAHLGRRCHHHHHRRRAITAAHTVPTSWCRPRSPPPPPPRACVSMRGVGGNN